MTDQENLSQLVDEVVKSAGELSSEDLQAADEAKKNTKAEVVRDDDIRTAIAKMRLPEKLKCAMFGGAVARSLLIRDANKMISLAVLKNPKLQSAEVEEFAKNPNLSEQVLRMIANSSEWMKSYSMKHSIVTNPKTPNDIALKWLRYMNAGDLKKLSKSKSVPSLISTTAKKRVADMAEKK